MPAALLKARLAAADGPALAGSHPHTVAERCSDGDDVNSMIMRAAACSE